MNNNNIKKINFSKYSLDDLLSLSSEIEQLMTDNDDKRIVFKEAKFIVDLYKNNKTALEAREIINKLNEAIVKKNAEPNNDELLIEDIKELIGDEEQDGRFIIKQTSEGYLFEFMDANNNVQFKSDEYTTLVSCREGIVSYKKNSMSKIDDSSLTGKKSFKGAKYVITKDKSGMFRYNLKASNGQILVTSEAFKSKRACKNAIMNVQKNLNTAETILL